MISESLSGKRLAITGSTGFLGTALVERLLRGVPDCELVLLVRPTRRNSAERRVEWRRALLFPRGQLEARARRPDRHRAAEARGCKARGGRARAQADPALVA